MTTTTEFKDAMNQLAGMRREIIALLLPLHTQLGFNVIENRLFPGVTIMLPPSDYAIFTELVAALPAHPKASATTDAPGQSPPAAGGVGQTVTLPIVVDRKELDSMLRDTTLNAIIKQLGAVPTNTPGLWDAPGYGELTEGQLLSMVRSR